MKVVKKTLCLLLTVIMVMGLFSSLRAEAKEISLPVPTIKVKAVSKGTGIKVTISKTKDAEGFEVYVYGKSIDYSEYKKVDDVYQKVADVNKNGNAKRTITIKSLPAGSYKIKVRSYNSKKYGTMTYSDFSKEKSAKVKEAANGYSTNYDFSKVKKGDVIKFGAYEQDGDFTNGKEAIEWIVLEKTKKQIFVVSKYALDALPYNKEMAEVTWEDCTLRKWLNEQFYIDAFNKAEQEKIIIRSVENFDNAVNGTAGGNDTKDKVFLLSQLEMIYSDYGFSENYNDYDVNRSCSATAYAITQGTWNVGNVKTSYGEDSCDWWLRTPGEKYKSTWSTIYEVFACRVQRGGQVDSYGLQVNRDDVCGVRPVLYITLNS